MKTSLPLIITVLGLTISVSLVDGGDYIYVTNNGAISITKYIGPGGGVTIPSTIYGLPVTAIGGWAFSGCSIVTSVTIPDSITSIGDEAFSECSGLTNVTVGNGVTSFGVYVFYYCSRLSSVTICRGVARIGDYAFVNCSSLTNVTIATGVTIIGAVAFGGCSSLTHITIPSSITTIEDGAFQVCENLTCVYFQGNAPNFCQDVFFYFSAPPPRVIIDPATMYYLPGTTGWNTNTSGRPTALWVLPFPVILTTATNFGIQTNALGFRISWATNVPVVVEASTTLADPDWSAVSTNSLTEGWYDFRDATWTNYPARFYRIRSQ